MENLSPQKGCGAVGDYQKRVKVMWPKEQYKGGVWAGVSIKTFFTGNQDKERNQSSQIFSKHREVAPVSSRKET